jgi:phosphatidylglycerophosphatase A
VNPAALIATFFGIGRFPFMPGTVASAAAAALAWPVAALLGPWSLAPLGFAVGIAGISVCDAYARARGELDPSSCVIDEVAGQWIALSVAPLSLPGFLAGFVFFRLFDILKIWPANRAERLPGGLGIMADDIVAGVMAAAAVLLLVRFGALR